MRRRIALGRGFAIAAAIVGCEVEVPLDGTFQGSGAPDGSISGKDASGGGSDTGSGGGSDGGLGGGSDGGNGLTDAGSGTQPPDAS